MIAHLKNLAFFEGFDGIPPRTSLRHAVYGQLCPFWKVGF